MADHPASVATTLDLAVSSLEAEYPPAAWLLRLLACLAPAPVPLDLLVPIAARDRLVAVLTAREKRSGRDHQETLAARANLARWTGEAGDLAAAIEQYAAVLPAMERVFGPDHPSILAARENILAVTKRIKEAQSEPSDP